MLDIRLQRRTFTISSSRTKTLKLKTGQKPPQSATLSFRSTLVSRTNTHQHTNPINTNKQQETLYSALDGHRLFLRRFGIHMGAQDELLDRLGEGGVGMYSELDVFDSLAQRNGVGCFMD
jgi:hypothetical protein